MRVLFVDDDAYVIEALRRQTRSSKVRAVFASSGMQALTILGSEAVDVVVSDMRMPDMDGAELLARVRDLQPQIMRIALSGDASPDLRERANAVAHAWLSKPCTFDRIRETIAALRGEAG